MTLVPDGPNVVQSTILVPFSPSALISAFGDEFFRRAIRQGVTVSSSTHQLKLLLNSAQGQLLDFEDLLGDVVVHPSSEIIFAKFSIKPELPVQSTHQVSPFPQSF